jgi:NAD(P)-dependent dehydrogenase (short-subunit alcohol dehydrogenase family)
VKWGLDVNVIGSARVAGSFTPLLRKSERGRLAFTTSSSIFDPASQLGAYKVSKFAVWGLAETIRLEFADDGIGVSVIFPSGMLSRHLETSEAAQPTHLRRPIADDGDFDFDFDAMIASNPVMASLLATSEDAAAGVIEAVLADERYIITQHRAVPSGVAGGFGRPGESRGPVRGGLDKVSERISHGAVSSSMSNSPCSCGPRPASRLSITADAST